MARVFLRSNLQLGQDEIEVNGPTVTLKQVLSAVMAKDKAVPRLIDPETGKLSQLFSFSVNRKNVSLRPDGAETKLKDNDSVEIALAMYAGG